VDPGLLLQYDEGLKSVVHSSLLVLYIYSSWSGCGVDIVPGVGDVEVSGCYLACSQFTPGCVDEDGPCGYR